MIFPWSVTFFSNEKDKYPYFFTLAKKKKGGSTGGKIDTSLGDGIFDLKSVKDEMASHVQKLKEELHNKYQPTLTVGKYLFIFIYFKYI